MALRWYAVQSNPVCEAKAAKGLKEHGFTVFLPVETKWKRSTRTKKRDRVDHPLFTGYLFVGLCSGQSLYHVRQIDGVRGLVSCGMGVPAEINARFVYDLQARQAAGEFDHTPARRSLFRKGDKARIMLDGPLKDQIAEVLGATDEGRVRLLLSAKFGWRTTLDCDQLEHPEEVLKAA